MDTNICSIDHMMDTMDMKPSQLSVIMNRSNLMTTWSRPLKKAFTMIEMAVVVAIIALLIAILLPALSAARKQAQGVSMDSETPLGEVTLESNEDDTYTALPLTATDIVEHGNQWYEFTLNDQRWLYHTDGYDQESLFLIPQQGWND